jgi:anaerobic magnesium-protoporphyrin IX monomethyl ester cyclase
MRINLLCIEDSLDAVGFRKIISYIDSIHDDVQGHYITMLNRLSPVVQFLLKKGEKAQWDQANIHEIAETLAQGDIIGFSSYTHHSDFTKRIISEVRSINPEAFIIWGGIHPSIHPEDAILHADAICVGEGEFAMEAFLTAYKAGQDFYGTKNFWFNKNGEIVRNDFFPLANSEQMEKFPLAQYGVNELIYKKGKGFVPLAIKEYLNNNALAYNTVWSIGCPYRCSFCGNTTFIENDKNYVKLRHPSVDYLVRQVKDVLRKHPHISTVVFYDDSFMAIPKRTMSEFAEKWKSEIGLPFCVQGVIPSFVQEEKLKILVGAGMNRLRMGIQSGSDRILEFYERPNKPGLIHHAATVITKFKNYMIPPCYDIILDNPIETKQDVEDTLKLLYSLPRPFTLNLFSLRVIPNSVMERQMKERNISVDGIAASNYNYYAPTSANILVCLLAIWRPPKWMFDYLLKFARPYTETQTVFPVFSHFIRTLYLSVRAFNHLRYMDFSTIIGRYGWVLWRLGFIRFWKNNILKSFNYGPSVNSVQNKPSRN